MFDNESDDELMPIAEAAEFLGFTKQTLYNYRYRKVGPPAEVYYQDVGRRQGSRRRVGYRKSALIEWRDTRTRKPRSPNRNKKEQKKAA